MGEVIAHPRLGAAALVFDDHERILLGQRGKEPHRGQWILPGGGVREHETLSEAIARELRQEAGIEVTLEGVIDIVDIMDAGDERRLVVYFRARLRSGRVEAASDLLDARFFTSTAVEVLVRDGRVTPTVAEVLRKHVLDARSALDAVGR